MHNERIRYIRNGLTQHDEEQEEEERDDTDEEKEEDEEEEEEEEEEDEDEEDEEEELIEELNTHIKKIARGDLHYLNEDATNLITGSNDILPSSNICATYEQFHSLRKGNTFSKEEETNSSFERKVYFSRNQKYYNYMNPLERLRIKKIMKGFHLVFNSLEKLVHDKNISLLSFSEQNFTTYKNGNIHQQYSIHENMHNREIFNLNNFIRGVVVKIENHLSENYIKRNIQHHIKKLNEKKFRNIFYDSNLVRSIKGAHYNSFLISLEFLYLSFTCSNYFLDDISKCVKTIFKNFPFNNTWLNSYQVRIKILLSLIYMLSYEIHFFDLEYFFCDILKIVFYKFYESLDYHDLQMYQFLFLNLSNQILFPRYHFMNDLKALVTNEVPIYQSFASYTHMEEDDMYRYFRFLEKDQKGIYFSDCLFEVRRKILQLQPELHQEEKKGGPMCLMNSLCPVSSVSSISSTDLDLSSYKNSASNCFSEASICGPFNLDKRHYKHNDTIEKQQVPTNENISKDSKQGTFYDRTEYGKEENFIEIKKKRENEIYAIHNFSTEKDLEEKDFVFFNENENEHKNENNNENENNSDRNDRDNINDRNNRNDRNDKKIISNKSFLDELVKMRKLEKYSKNKHNKNIHNKNIQNKRKIKKDVNPISQKKKNSQTSKNNLRKDYTDKKNIYCVDTAKEVTEINEIIEQETIYPILKRKKEITINKYLNDRNQIIHNILEENQKNRYYLENIKTEKYDAYNMLNVSYFSYCNEMETSSFLVGMEKSLLYNNISFEKKKGINILLNLLSIIDLYMEYKVNIFNTPLYFIKNVILSCAQISFANDFSIVYIHSLIRLSLFEIRMNNFFVASNILLELLENLEKVKSHKHILGTIYYMCAYILIHKMNYESNLVDDINVQLLMDESHCLIKQTKIQFIFLNNKNKKRKQWTVPRRCQQTEQKKNNISKNDSCNLPFPNHYSENIPVDKTNLDNNGNLKEKLNTSKHTNKSENNKSHEDRNKKETLNNKIQKEEKKEKKEKEEETKGETKEETNIDNLKKRKRKKRISIMKNQIKITAFFPKTKNENVEEPLFKKPESKEYVKTHRLVDREKKRRKLNEEVKTYKKTVPINENTIKQSEKQNAEIFYKKVNEKQMNLLFICFFLKQSLYLWKTYGDKIGILNGAQQRKRKKDAYYFLMVSYNLLYHSSKFLLNSKTTILKNGQRKLCANHDLYKTYYRIFQFYQKKFVQQSR